MRFFSLLPVLAALVTVVAGAALPRADGDCGSSEMGCKVAQSATKRDFSGRGPSNADLLRRGFAIKNPIMRRGPPPNNKPSSAPPKPSPGPSPDNIRHRGIIAVKKQSDKSILGYVSSTSLTTGQYRYKDISSALVVDFDLPKNGPNDKLNLFAENAGSGFPLVGLVQGRDDGADTNLAAGSFKYTYLAGTVSTPPGSPALVIPNSYIDTPGRAAESAIWSFDPVTKILLPLWVNTDKQCPAVQVFVQSTGVYVGGDANAFFKKYPAPVDKVDLVFVQL